LALIKSRKHQAGMQPRLTGTAAALATLALPMALHAQEAAPSAAPAASAPAAAAPASAPSTPAATPTPRPGSQALPEIKVQGAIEAPFKADTVSSPKFTQPLVDTPQTITVITRELIQQRSASTLTEALRNSPGITLLLGENGNTQTGDAVVMRGFDTSASIFVDNIRDLGAISRDMFNIDQVEVVKGPSGADNGRGASSGYINLVSKAPSLTDANGGSVMLGSESRRRITLDLNRKFDIGLPGTAFRLNLMQDQGGVPGRDHVENDVWAIAPTLSIGLGTPTRTTLYYLHSEARNRPDGGVPTIGLAGFIDPAFQPGGFRAGQAVAAPDRSNYYGALDDRNDVDVDMFTARIEHTVSPGTVLTNTARLAHSSQLYVIGGFSGTTRNSGAIGGCGNGWWNVCSDNPAEWTLVRNRQASQRSNDLVTNQTNLATEFMAGGLKHNLSGGVEFIYEQQRTSSASASTGTPANLYNPSVGDTFPVVVPGANGTFTEGDTLTAALYAFDTLALNEQVKLNGGLRWEKFRTQTDSAALSTATSHPTLPVGTLVPTSLGLGDTLLSWKVGALYKPQPNGTYYISFANSKFPPGSANFTLNASATNAANPRFDPQEGQNTEIGTKWDLLDGKLSLAGALYRSVNQNEVITDPTDANAVIPVGERRVQGLELSAAGQLSPGWDINVGLGWMDAEITRGTSTTQGGLLQWTPEYSLTAWSSYRLAGGWVVGGGVRYIDSIVRASTNPPPTTGQSGLFEAESYAVADAMVTYEFSKNITFQLNLFNLLDEEYVAALNNSGKRYIPGEPRSYQLTASFKF
jgi:catecholate siderophore receptor